MDSLSVFTAGTFIIGGLALLFAFSNGFRDSSSIVATVVSTRALTPSYAFFLCAFFEVLGALFIGSAVVATIGKNLFAPDLLPTQFETITVLSSALGASILWGGMSWWRAWPTSNNQSIMAGLVGASVAVWTWDGLNQKTIIVVFAVLVSSPIIGFIVSTFVTKMIRFAGQWLTPKVSPLMKRLQIFSCCLVSCAHGSNDGQMVMGIIVLGMGFLGQSMEVPFVVRFFVALSIAFGVMLGGQKILKKIGMRFYHIRPTQGVGAQLSSAGTILTCALTGFPASTMQVITGAIVGAGVAKNPRAVRWFVAREIILSWIITIPTVGLLGYIIGSIIKNWGG